MRLFWLTFVGLLLSAFACCQVGYNPVTVEYHNHNHFTVELDSAEVTP